MSNFFQSPLRYDIKTLVYGDSTFKIQLFDREYFGIEKKKKFGPLSLSWFQILGVELPSHNYGRIRQEIDKTRHDFGGHWGNMFVQWGITNEIVSMYNHSHRSTENEQGYRKLRLDLEDELYHQTGLIPSFRENMPLATIIIDTNKDDETLLNEMNSGAKNHVRKAINQDLEFRQAEASEYEHFYEERQKVSQIKGFHTIGKSTFFDLMKYITDNNCGNIFVAYKDNVLLGGSIAVYYEDTITYLYGFSNRNPKFRNIGVHQFIKYKMFHRARENGYQYMDLFGGAPTGFPEHKLTSVSAFKESLGGKKVERYGNYDIILNTPLYHLMRKLYQRKS